MTTTVKEINSIPSSKILFCWRGEDIEKIEKLGLEKKVIAFLVVPSENYPCDEEECGFDCSNCPYGKSVEIPEEQKLAIVISTVGDVLENINNFYAILPF